MGRPALVLLAVVSVLVGCGAISALHDKAVFDAERQSLPPHVAPAVAQAPEPLQVADVPEVQTITVGAALDQQAADQQAKAAREQADIEARQRDAHAVAAAPPPVRGSPPPSPGGSCAGDVDCFLACTRAHESDTAGGYQAVSPDGVYRGAYQYLASTWRVVAVNAGYPEWADTPVDQVPPAVQDAVAAFHYGIAGNTPWGGRC